MGKHHRDSRSRSRSRTHSSKRAKHEAGSAPEPAAARSRSRSTSSKRDKPSKKNKEHKSSSSSKREKKHDKKQKKESKESKKKDKKKHHSDKKDKKQHKRHKRSRSSSSSSDDSSSSDSERSSSSSRSRSRSMRGRKSASVAASSMPPPSAQSVQRCCDLVQTLLKHGSSGDEERTLQDFQFLLFKLDSGSSVDLSGLPDPLVRHVLQMILREMGCRVRRDEVTGEEGWMVPVDPKSGKRAYKLLDVLADAFKKPSQQQQQQTSVTIGPIGPTAPPAHAAAASVASVAGAALPPLPAADDSAGLRVVGPSMPTDRDFERMAAMMSSDDAGTATKDTEGDDDGFNYGPKMPSQMTEQERAAFDRLRASREQLAALRAASSAANADKEAGREEWMTALPSAESGRPSAEQFVAAAAAGEREAMRGRGFATGKQARTGTVEQDALWAMSPAEQARHAAERAAIRQAEQAVYESSLAVGGSEHASFGRRSANVSAAAAQAANDRMMARYKSQQAGAAQNSLLAHHQRAQEAAKSKKKKDADGLFVWDHDTEMGLRGVKGPEALRKEMKSAYSLNDNFAPASGI